MSILHHIAFDGNLEAFHELLCLPYIKEVINDNNNEVIIIIVTIPIGWLDPSFMGLH